MKKLSLFLCVALVGIAQAQEQEKTKVENDPYYMGAALVTQVFALKHRAEKGEDNLRLAIMENGANTNRLGTVVLSLAGQEGAQDPFPVHKVSIRLSSVKSVKAKWHNVENSTAGGYITIKGTRYNIETQKTEAAVVQIKYTDSTNVYLDQLEVNAYTPEKS